MKRPQATFGSESGLAVILVVVAMGIFLIGALGLAVDGGQMYAQRQMAQAAADAAAQAGIMNILDGTNATWVNSSPARCNTTDLRTPCVYARFNGFGQTTSDFVTLSFPTTVAGVGLSAGTTPALTVTVRRDLPTGLIRFVGAGPTSTVTARATAGLVGAVSSNCIYVLDPSAANAFVASNGASVVVSGCAIAVNSTNSRAAAVTGGADVTASAVQVVGGVVISNGGTMTPAPDLGVAPVDDPFASVVGPAVGACDFNNYDPGWGNYTLDPGTYCGGIRISNGATAKFNPGIYIIKGGGLDLGAAKPITGNGVMFYLTGTNSTYRSVSIGNGQTVTFSGPTSGPYIGIVFFQDRAITSSSNATFSGGADMQITGTLYFSKSSVLFSNGSGVANYNTAIVAKQVSFTGGTNIQYDSTGLKTGLFSKAVALVQ